MRRWCRSCRSPAPSSFSRPERHHDDSDHLDPDADGHDDEQDERRADGPAVEQDHPIAKALCLLHEVGAVQDRAAVGGERALELVPCWW
jgi:hypothetical protein